MTRTERNQNYITAQRDRRNPTYVNMPDDVLLPGKGDVPPKEIPLTEATIDDLIFSQTALKSVMIGLIMQMKSLQIIHDHARREGGKGADNAIEVIREATGKGREDEQ